MDSLAASVAREGIRTCLNGHGLELAMPVHPPSQVIRFPYTGPMPSRSLARLVLYVLLLSSQLWPGAAMPAHAGPSMAVGQATHAMPCHDAMAATEAPSAPDCKGPCCPHMTCDTGTCATLACLPVVAGVALASQPAQALVRWSLPASLPRLPESPLRPPIA